MTTSVTERQPRPASPYELPWTPQPLRVPTDSPSVLAVPRIDLAPELVRAHHAWLQRHDRHILGRPLSELRDWARGAALQEAYRYTEELLQRPLPRKPFEHVVATGHQPELFHPGVWIKNFAVGHIAEQTYAAPLNIIVDTDTVDRVQIPVPIGTREAPRLQWVAFDDPHHREPWELAKVRNRKRFAEFRSEVCRLLQSWHYLPLLADCWRDATARLQQTDRLVDCLVAARHKLERRWKLNNLELPLSRLCETDPFRWFLARILADIRRFHEIHNSVLREYRQVHRVRSTRHPVPALATRDDWYETPFWVWADGEQQRRRLFARPVAGGVELADDERPLGTVRIDPDDATATALPDLRRLSTAGWRFRTRALTTTMFVRVFLSDLFIHGIGGARYDEMTDRIIARFFEIPPPEFQTITATLWLPIGPPFDVDPADLRRIDHGIRELTYNADRYLPGGVYPEADALMLRKEQLIEEQHQAEQRRGLTRRERRALAPANRRRFLEFREIDAKLAAFAQPQRQHLLQLRSELLERLQANEILTRRDYPYCLYDEASLRALIRQAFS
ncbi:MAG: hypothetical protein D6725_08215 [Planctomycetota bacterium]|nr:MAG: hypothetical protein D6725_08215 [Planctomycetota bacterium]